MAATDEIAVAARARRFLAAHARLRPTEALPWLVAVAAFFVFPDRLTFGSQVLVMALFALSLDLVLGYAGILTLGHAAFFGIGAYTVGLLAARLDWTEPLTGLLAAATCAGFAGALSGVVLLRYRGLTLLVLTLSTTFILQEFGNVFDRVTGGYDGLPGLSFSPVLGVFDYDLFGRTAYLYALAVLFVCFCLARAIVVSPFGRSLVGIRENTARMHSIGAPVHGRLLVAYTVSAALAGVAGALHAHTNAFVTLSVFDFENSAGVLVMLILGGTGRLYGAFWGAVVYMVLQDSLAKFSPAFWQAGVGLLLIVTVLFARAGILGLVEAAGRRLRGGGP
ncbi:branched-chain amino acid ABC transporter permease [Xanthobacteraceae bacterium Astr-EGSB]|uniref:branched-chain amino acid ABC transporter permease n=1 Tax=Astrobacterium formosum TaxID=3069710 RepID=UPI0027B2E1BB|nr:branched-chain amino acid ABC transporter permease [Xanthobacteraceae bacterium Astr-EGSB]